MLSADTLEARMRDMFANAIMETQSTSCANPVRVSAHDVAIIARRLAASCIAIATNRCHQEFIDPKSDENSARFFANICAGHAYKVCDLLREEKRELLRSILSKKVDVRNVAAMDIFSIAELCPSVLQEERRVIALRTAQKTEITTSTLYECKKCHARRAIVTERQVRSSDEAPTCFIECVECQYRWTQNK